MCGPAVGDNAGLGACEELGHRVVTAPETSNTTPLMRNTSSRCASLLFDCSALDKEAQGAFPDEDGCVQTSVAGSDAGLALLALASAAFASLV